MSGLEPTYNSEANAKIIDIRERTFAFAVRYSKSLQVFRKEFGRR
jgi:hypothetical protein